jgi:Nif-specific ferredoxin III
MAEYLTRDGSPWTPKFIEAIDHEKCIGCGRCFKVCGRGVLELKGISEDHELVDADDGEVERMVMTIANAGACIGCNACATVCGKSAQTHVTAA